MTSTWTIHETIATLQGPLLSGEVDVLFPWRGFSLAASKSADAAVLKVFTRGGSGAAPETLVDCYQRGADLVATYAQTPERNFRPQIYWRYLEISQRIAALELILSAQTSLLDSQPTTAFESSLPASEILAIDGEGATIAVENEEWKSDLAAPRAILFRPQHLAASYLEMVHPTDFAGVQLLRQSHCVRWRLFPDRLEKGVIRRGRVRGVLLAREHDLETAREQMQLFAATPLVLST